MNVQLHVVAVNGDGIPIRPDGSAKEMSSLQFDEHVSRVCEAAEAAVKNGKGILVYAHGGRNSYKSALAKAAEIATKLENDLDDPWHPVFLNWHTGDLSCYADHLFRVRRGRVHRYYRWITWLWLLISDLGRAIFHLPASVYLQLINDCKPFLPGHNPERATSEVLFHRLKVREEDDEHSISVAIGQDQRMVREKWRSAICLILTYVPIKIAMGALIDAVGSSLWDNMLRRSKTAFRRADEFDLRDHVTDVRRLDAALDQSPSGGFGRFGVALSERVSRLKSEHHVRLSIAGHSMGSIVVNRLLTDHPDLQADSVIFMGAACSINDFVDYMVPYLRRHGRTQFANLCLHPVAEQSEVNLVEIVPRGSLLVWLDNFMADPTTIPDRTLGTWENLLQATHLIPRDLRGRVTLKAFGVGRYSSGPQKHGDFDEYPFWKSSFWATDPDGEPHR